jgi:hypothetical protein
MATPSQELKPPTNPVRFSSQISALISESRMLTGGAELRDLSVEWREERVGWDSALFFF